MTRRTSTRRSTVGHPTGWMNSENSHTVACKYAYRGDRRTLCWLEFPLDTTCKPSCQAQWSGESMTAWIWNTIKHNVPTSGCTNISTIIEIIELSFAGQIKNHLSSNHFMSEKSPFCRAAYYIWISANSWWWRLKPQFRQDQTSNHTNISECKHMQGMKQIFQVEWDRPKKIPAQQVLYQWTVELPLALKLPRCAIWVQWINLISGPDRVRVIIKLIWFYVLCNGAL